MLFIRLEEQITACLSGSCNLSQYEKPSGTTHREAPSLQLLKLQQKRERQETYRAPWVLDRAGIGDGLANLRHPLNDGGAVNLPTRSVIGRHVFLPQGNPEEREGRGWAGFSGMGMGGASAA